MLHVCFIFLNSFVVVVVAMCGFDSFILLCSCKKQNVVLLLPLQCFSRLDRRQ